MKWPPPPRLVFWILGFVIAGGTTLRHDGNICQGNPVEEAGLGAGPRCTLSLSTSGVVLFPAYHWVCLALPWQNECPKVKRPTSCFFHQVVRARVLVWMWNGTHRLSCLNCPQIVEALFAGQGGGRNLWDSGSSRRSGSLERALMFLCASGQRKPQCKLLCDVQSHFKFQASLVGWINFPETVSQDK